MRSKLLVALVSCLITAAVVGGFAIAAIPNGNTINACRNKATFVLRVIDKDLGQTCTSSETALSWSSWRWSGPFLGSSSYRVGDVVRYSGSSYLAKGPLAPPAGTLPTNTSYWALVVAKGDPGPAGPQGVAGPAGPAGVNAVGVVEAVAVGRNPWAIEFDGSSLWVAENAQARVAQIDPVSGEIVGRTNVEGNPSSILRSADGVWVQAGSRLTKLGALTVSGGFAAPRDGMSVGPSGLWVLTSGSTSHALVFDEATGAFRRSFQASDLSAAIEIVDSSLWIVDNAPNTGITRLTRYTEATGTFNGQFAPGTSNAVALEFDGASLWLGSNPGRGVLQRIDPATGAVLSTIEVGSEVSALFVDGDTVWVAGGQSKSVVGVDRTTGGVIATVFLGDNVVDLTSDGVDLWAVLSGGVVARIRR